MFSFILTVSSPSGGCHRLQSSDRPDDTRTVDRNRITTYSLSRTGRRHVRQRVIDSRVIVASTTLKYKCFSDSEWKDLFVIDKFEGMFTSSHFPTPVSCNLEKSVFLTTKIVLLHFLNVSVVRQETLTSMFIYNVLTNPRRLSIRTTLVRREVNLHIHETINLLPLIITSWY